MSKSESMQHRAEFYKIFREQITPILRNYEVYRKKEYDKFVVHVCIIIPVIMLGIYFFIALFEPYINIFYYLPHKAILMCFIQPIIILFALLYSSLYTIHIMKKNAYFQAILKEDCLEKILSVFGDIQWKTNCKWICNTDLEKCGLFIPFNKRTIDDTFKGTWRGVNYKISETCLEDIHSSGRTATYIRVFSGIIIQLKCNKIVKNRTIVTTKGNFTRQNYALIISLLLAAICILRGGFSLSSIIIACISFLITYIVIKIEMAKEEPLNKVTLEDPKFNKRFNVYSSDQVEARYLVTPSFMERLYNLQTSFGAKTIKCSFYEDSLMIAISTKRNLFELGDLFHPLLETSSHVQLYRDLHSILNLIEYFKLDEKVGL